jgi:hypothetical protein
MSSERLAVGRRENARHRRHYTAELGLRPPFGEEKGMEATLHQLGSSPRCASMWPLPHWANISPHFPSEILYGWMTVGESGGPRFISFHPSVLALVPGEGRSGFLSIRMALRGSNSIMLALQQGDGYKDDRYPFGGTENGTYAKNHELSPPRYHESTLRCLR